MKIPLWLSANHPIYARENQRYARLKAWQIARWVVLPCFAIGPLIPAAIQMIVTWPAYYSFPGYHFVIYQNLVMTLLVAAGMLNFLTFIILSIGGALTIAAERQNQSWVFLRLTKLSPFEILAAKVAAVIRQAFPWLLLEGAIFLCLCVIVFLSVSPEFSIIFSAFPHFPPRNVIEFSDYIIYVMPVTVMMLAMLAFVFNGLATLIARPISVVVISALASSYTRSFPTALTLGLLFHTIIFLVLGSSTIFGGFFVVLPFGINAAIHVGLAVVVAHFLVARTMAIED